MWVSHEENVLGGKETVHISFKGTQDWAFFFGSEFEFYTISLLVMLKY